MAASDAEPEKRSASAFPALSLKQIDPRGLIGDAFAMSDIQAADCRSIFFDWALGLDAAIDQTRAIEQLIDAFADAPHHPMRAVLDEGLRATPARRPSERRRDARRRAARAKSTSQTD